MPKGIYPRTEKHLNDGCFKTGHKMSKETIEKIRLSSIGRKWPHPVGKKASNWRGDMVGYRAIHCWIEKTLGKPKKCQECGDSSEQRYEWSNISGEYKRDKSDWERLCVYCHRIKDFKKAKERKQNGISTRGI